MAVPCSTMSLTELSDGLVDRHVVRNHVIVDQKLKLVTDAVPLIHQNCRQAVIHIVFAIVVVAIGQILVANTTVASDDQVLFDSLDQS